MHVDKGSLSQPSIDLHVDKGSLSQPSIDLHVNKGSLSQPSIDLHVDKGSLSQPSKGSVKWDKRSEKVNAKRRLQYKLNPIGKRLINKMYIVFRQKVVICKTKTPRV